MGEESSFLGWYIIIGLCLICVWGIYVSANWNKEGISRQLKVRKILNFNRGIANILELFILPIIMSILVEPSVSFCLLIFSIVVVIAGVIILIFLVPSIEEKYTKKLEASKIVVVGNNVEIKSNNSERLPKQKGSMIPVTDKEIKIKVENNKKMGFQLIGLNKVFMPKSTKEIGESIFTVKTEELKDYANMHSAIPYFEVITE